MIEKQPAPAAQEAPAKREHAMADDSTSDGKPERVERKCYVCGGMGHIASMCTSAQGASEDPHARECHLCHGRGHIRAACPNALPKNMCFKCHGLGHLGR